MKLPNGVKVIFGTIFLGAVGSGAWEWILSPFLHVLTGGITTFLSFVSRQYADSIYSSAAQFYPSNPSENLGLFFLLSCFGITFFYAAFFYMANSKPDNTFAQAVKKAMREVATGWLGITYFGAVLVFVLFLFSRQDSVEKIQRVAYFRMEVARPLVGERKYTQLRARYVQVNSKKDFDDFLADLSASSSAVSQESKPLTPK